MFRNFKTVPKFVYGRGCFDQLDDILAPQRGQTGGRVVFIVDDVFANSELVDRLPSRSPDQLLLVNTDDEPTTDYVDELTEKVRQQADTPPDAVVGIGGGSTMDLAKAISLMLTNPGSAADYQGWDLIGNPAVYHLCAPTLSGTGAEVSRTTVLTGPEKKLGINSDYTVYDQIIMDPDLTAGAPREQRFFTGMDCYIHCVESLCGTYLNAFSQAYGEKALALCEEVFLKPGPDSDEKLMVASYFGGMSIAYSQVGICHALSYGLSFVLKIHHGIGNSIAFDYLHEYYPQGVEAFRKMLDINQIKLPRGVTADLSEKDLDIMVDVAYQLDPLWENALGSNWKTRMPRERVRELYRQM